MDKEKLLTYASNQYPQLGWGTVPIADGTATQRMTSATIIIPSSFLECLFMNSRIYKLAPTLYELYKAYKEFY